MCATCCIVVYIVGFFVLFLLFLLLLAYSHRCYHVVLLYLLFLCSCSCSHYCCRWCAIIVFFLCRHPSFVVMRLPTSSPSCCYHSVLLFRVVSCCFVLFCVVSCCSCPCPCGCCFVSFLLVPPLFIEGNSHSYQPSNFVFARATVPY